VESFAGGGAAHSLSLRGVSKHYGAVKAVDDVDLVVPRGEFLTLLGPSGSGKTTILMMIAGFARPTSGDILLDDHTITHLPPEKRNFGMVFQGYALFPHMTVAQNVGFPLKVRHMGRAEAEPLIASALDLVQLAHLRDRLPRQLSGGQQQRVALARALVFSPDILLLDEPLGALDKKLRSEVQIELKDLHRRVGTTFLYVTHDQEEALSMSDRIAIVRDGRFVQIGRPDDLYERPATRFVADFLGESNFIRGRRGDAMDGGFTIAADGLELRQAGTPPAESDVLIALRPEKVAVGTKAANGGANCIAGTVEAFNYFGSTLHYVVNTTGLGSIKASVRAWQAEVAPQEGEHVFLTWTPDASVVVRDD
jgi:putative spermidine/putrescine transport system ATP-binding protein